MNRRAFLGRLGIAGGGAALASHLSRSRGIARTHEGTFELRAPESNPKRGGTLRYGVVSSPAHFDIHQSGTVANLAEGQRTATLESKTNFIAGCRAGTIQAEAKPIHKGRRTHVWETRITDEAGKLLSVTTQTQMIL